MLSSINDSPLVTIPSTGIFSPGFIRIKSFINTSFMGINSSFPFLTTVISFGCKSINFFIADEALVFALSSRKRPSKINVMITTADS